MSQEQEEAWRLARKKATWEHRVRVYDSDPGDFPPEMVQAAKKKLQEYTVKVSFNEEAQAMMPVAEEYVKAEIAREEEINESVLGQLYSALDTLTLADGTLSRPEDFFDDEDAESSWRDFLTYLEAGNARQALVELRELVSIVNADVSSLVLPPLPKSPIGV